MACARRGESRTARIASPNGEKTMRRNNPTAATTSTSVR